MSTLLTLAMIVTGFALYSEGAGIDPWQAEAFGWGFNIWPNSQMGVACGKLAERTGFTAVEAARGRLVHAVNVNKESRILIYAMAALAEWHFHPFALVTTLPGEKVGRAAEAQAAAEALALRIDPCCADEAAVREYA